MILRRGSVIAIACVLCASPFFASADTQEELQAQIDANNAQVQQLNIEIAQYQKQLNSTTAQKNTLQSKIYQLDLQRKQLTAKINVTKNQIKTTQIQIQQLSDGIANKQSTIESDTNGLAESLRILNESEQRPLALSILSAENISDAWKDADRIASLQSDVRADIARLNKEKQSLTDTKAQAEAKRAQLQQQQSTLGSQQGSLSATRQAQSELLAQTKSRESNYQKIIAEKKAAKADFEATLNALQAKLKAADTSSIPIAGTSVLRWPLDNVRITQYFGDTAFSRTAAYKGKGHNGIDLGAAIGTPVYAALAGSVVETNLGTAPNCQYGKWVLLRHANGLSTLYAHLSSVSVSAGQAVATRQLLGYSGDTGYATGPHLHFTVYNTSGVSFVNYRCNSGKTVRVPVSPFNGYLNPMSYLPSL